MNSYVIIIIIIIFRRIHFINSASDHDRYYTSPRPQIDYFVFNYFIIVLKLADFNADNEKR